MVHLFLFKVRFIFCCGSHSLSNTPTRRNFVSIMLILITVFISSTRWRTHAVAPQLRRLCDRAPHRRAVGARGSLRHGGEVEQSGELQAAALRVGQVNSSERCFLLRS